MDKENQVKKSFTQTNFNVTTNPGSLKYKLNQIENVLRNLDDEMILHTKEVDLLKSEKENLQHVLNEKTTNIKDTIAEELMNIEGDMKKHFSHQKAENSRLQQQITTLKGEKTSLQQQLIGLQRRIAELELQIGNEENNQYILGIFSQFIGIFFKSTVHKVRLSLIYYNRLLTSLKSF